MAEEGFEQGNETPAKQRVTNELRLPTMKNLQGYTDSHIAEKYVHMPIYLLAGLNFLLLHHLSKGPGASMIPALERVFKEHMMLPAGFDWKGSEQQLSYEELVPNQKDYLPIPCILSFRT